MKHIKIFIGRIIDYFLSAYIEYCFEQDGIAAEQINSITQQSQEMLRSAQDHILNINKLPKVPLKDIKFNLEPGSENQELTQVLKKGKIEMELALEETKIDIDELKEINKNFNSLVHSCWIFPSQ